MSQQQGGVAVGAPVGESLTEESIVNHLKSHPDFFERHAQLVLSLKLPHRAGGASISLVERQVSMLRQRNAQLERQLKDLVAVAKQNDSLMEKIHQLCLKLMGAPSVAARLECLETGLREDFAAERAVLALIATVTPESMMREGFVRRVSVEDADVRPFAAFLRAAKPRCGPLRDSQKGIFGRDADNVSSAAFVPLGHQAELGFLLIGSRDPDHFHPGKRMDFLARLGEVLAVALRAG